ncbi:MAG: hypothetical protein QMD03_03790 [Syntrophales bacterium]|nr:hypothetical protein [Syntrophales bacterium]
MDGQLIKELLAFEADHTWINENGEHMVKAIRIIFMGGFFLAILG